MNKVLSFFVAVTVVLCTGRDAMAQSEAVNRVMEGQKPDLSLYFYPSTLRMINLSQNEEFDRLIRDIRKIRFFQWSSTNYGKIDERSLVRELFEEEFEECMSIKSGAMNLMVFGRDQIRNHPELVAIVEIHEQVQLIDIEGMVNVTKIPDLINNLNSDDFINVLDLNKKEQKKQPNKEQ